VEVSDYGIICGSDSTMRGRGKQAKSLRGSEIRTRAVLEKQVPYIQTFRSLENNGLGLRVFFCVREGLYSFMVGGHMVGGHMSQWLEVNCRKLPSNN
jgi:hypothetical protein